MNHDDLTQDIEALERDFSEGETDSEKDDDEEQKVVSAEIMNITDWNNFDFGKLSQTLNKSELQEKYLAGFGKFWKKNKSDDLASRLAYAYLKLQLTADEYKDRRKRRAKQPQTKIAARLKRSESKIRKAQEDHQRLITEQAKIQEEQQERQKKIQAARSKPRPQED